MQKVTIICSSEFALLTQFVFSMLYIFSTTIEYTHQLCLLYMLHYPVIYSLSERESGSKHAKNCVHLSNENFLATIKNLSRPMPEHIEALS